MIIIGAVVVVIFALAAVMRRSVQPRECRKSCPCRTMYGENE